MMAVVLLISIFSGLALASDGVGGGDVAGSSFLPIDISSSGDLESLADGAAHIEAEPAVDSLAAEELPHSGLERPEAAELLEQVFGGGLESSAEFLGDLDVEAFRSDHVAVVAPPEPGADPGLVSSLLPLRAENEQGNKELIDLSLESQGDHLEASNPLVPVEIPAELSEGITLPDLGIVINVGAGETARRASEVGDATAFFPNVRTDSDLVVSPIPTGIETYTQLRSAEAPTTETFDLTLPKGGQLEETTQGAQVVDPSGSPILSIYAPFAIDAEEASIPVSVNVLGDSRVVVSVDPPADAAYPILVDPIFENYTWMNSNSNTGISTDWRSATQNQDRLWPSWIGVWNQTMHAGLNLRSYSGAITPGSQATWNYYVPRYFSDYEDPEIGERPTSFIRNMTLSQVYFLIEEGSPVHEHPFMLFGLWDGNKNEFASVGTRNGLQGPYNGVSLPLPNPGEFSTVKSGGFSLSTFESSSYPRQAFAGGAWVELSDKDSPVFEGVGSVPEWVSTKAGTSFSYKATDLGMGIHNLRLEYLRATGITAQPITGLGCTGNASNPCLRTVRKTTKAIPYYPDLMAQGENEAKLYAVDAVGHWSEAAQVWIKVDRAKPELVAEDTLTEQSKVGVNLPEYKLYVYASDGDELTAAATTPTGGAGTGPGQLERPQGLAVDAAGNTWVSDRTNQKITEYDQAGKLIRELTAKGSGDGQINEPRGVATASNGNIWVAEAGNKRLQQFSSTGAFVSKITNGSFVEPWGLAVSPDGTIWVADPGANKVFLFKEDGTLIRSISSTPVMGGGVPFGIDVDELGNAWVALQGTDKVMALNPSGEVLLSFGGTGTETGKFKAPVDLAIAPSGNIFVSDDANSRIQEFRPGGSFLRQFGTLGSASNQLKEPRAIDLGPGNVLMVADAGNKRVARWSHADRHPESGVVKTEIKVDNVLKDITSPGCPNKNCALRREWTLKADDYSVGQHTVEVIATDGVGLQTKKTFQVETHGDLQAPSLALSGTMTEQAALGNTRPTYKLKVVAADPGLSTERKSGVASTSIKVDGVTVDSTSPGCPGGGCSITREWTLNSNSYSVGTHLVEVKATDAAGRSTTTLLSLKVERDTTPPALTLSGALPTAPEGWVQQEIRSASAEATDPNGYGVKQIRFLIDGVVKGETPVQSCTGGGCSKATSFSIDMSQYSGGAHQALMVAEDGAGNRRNNSWTINVDPSGVISATEATETLEAVEETSAESPLDPANEDVEYEGSASGLKLVDTASGFEVSGSAVPTVIGDKAADGAELAVLPEGALSNACEEETDSAEEEAAKSVEEVFDAEEKEPAMSTCTELGSDDVLLQPLDVRPIGTATTATENHLVGGSATVAANTAQHVDTVTRPIYEGAMTFRAIRDSAAPGIYLWHVDVEPDQELRAVNDQQAVVYYKGHGPAFSIKAIAAHDAVGTTVPTSIEVVGPDSIALTVHHKDQAFVYPVVAGVGWQGGFTTYFITPLSEGEEEEPGSVEGIGGAGRHVFVRMRSEGPPVALSSSKCDAIGPDGAWCRYTYGKKYNFKECYYEGPDVVVPEPPKRVQLINEAVENCKSKYGWRRLEAKLSVHGWYRTNTLIDQVWIEKGNLQCDKWGKDEPAKVDCEKRPKDWERGVGQPGHIEVLGDYRFWPGTGPAFDQPPGGEGTSACVTVSGEIEFGHGTDSEETIVTPATQGDPCNWP